MATGKSVEPSTVNSNSENSDRFVLAPIARVRAGGRFTQEAREKAAAVALPLIAEGASVREIAAELGIDHKTLRSWLVVHDEPGYRAALAMQVSSRLTDYAVQAEECAADAALGASILREPQAVAEHARAAELVRAARARAGVLRDGAAHWQWLGERRLPGLFRHDPAAGAGSVRATFNFRLGGTTLAADGTAVPQAITVDMDTTESASVELESIPSSLASGVEDANVKPVEPTPLFGAENT